MQTVFRMAENTAAQEKAEPGSSTPWQVPFYYDDPDGGGRAPQRDGPQLRGPGVGHRQQAEPARQDGRARGSLDGTSGDHHPAGVGQRDQHARPDEEEQAELEDALASVDVTERAGRDDRRRGTACSLPATATLEELSRGL